MVTPGEGSRPLQEVSPEFTDQLEFMGSSISVTSVPVEGPSINILPLLRDPGDFHGDPHVHDVVLFGRAMESLIGTHTDPSGFFADRDHLPDRGIIILTDHVAEARQVVGEIDRLAQMAIADPGLYDDPAFCAGYRDLAKAGYDLQRKH